MGELRRELGVRDTTLFAVACIVGTRWIAAAAHTGPGSITLWLLAAVLFMAPLAIAVGALTARHPHSGGLYLWTRADFGAWHAFLAFWMYWLSMAFWFPGAAMFYMSAGLHALGLPDERWLVLAVSFAAIWIGLLTNLVGMRIGKWTENIGGFSAWAVSGLLTLLAILAWRARGSATVFHFAPRWDWNTVNFWATIAYAMSGIELAGMMAGEVRDPERSFRRAGWISSLCVTLFYGSATAAVLVLLPPQRVTEINGLAQAGDAAAQALGVGALAPVVALLVVGSGMGQLGGAGTALSRLPFAAAADGLLPEAFARVHPRWGTPYVSILTLGGVATFLLFAIQLGDTMRAAYQETVALMVIGGFLPFGYIFASSWRAGHRVSAVSGWAVTLLAIICAAIPTDEIERVWLYEFKLAVGTAAMIGSAWLFYRRRAARQAPRRQGI